MFARISLLAALLCLPQMAMALIVLDSRTSGNNTFNTTAPANGAPWSNVAQQQRIVSGSPIIDSSAVYIGNGYLLAASHTYAADSVILDGVSYAIDTSFNVISFAPIDARLYKILNPPALPLIPLPDATDSDLSRACTMIGWGKGKGTIVANSGWQWGDNSTKTKRWGTNTTGSSSTAVTYGGYSYNATYTLFDANSNPNASGQTEAGAAESDSGGGLFQQFTTGGPWKLSALMTLANYNSTTYPGGATLYTNNTSYASFAVRTKDFADKLRYRQWKEAKGIATATAAEDDSDADGIGLLEEYAFGLDPAAPSASGIPAAGVEGTDATLTYQLERTRTDLTIHIEESTDLTTWITANVTSTSTVSDNGTIRTYKAKVPLNGADRKFLRLKLSALTN